jgi:hypothetical protein
LCIALALASSCDSPPAFPPPSGPPRAIALDVRLPVYVLGRWTIDGFSETLRLELAKYNITVAERRSHESIVARIDLGRVTYRQWQEIDVALAHDDETTLLGRIQVPDLSMTTLDVAAQSVATLIAKWIWRTASATAERPAGPAGARPSPSDIQPRTRRASTSTWTRHVVPPSGEYSPSQ